MSCAPCEARADGHEQARILVILRDVAGQPMRGASVAMFAADTGERLAGPAHTDEEGFAAAAISSRAAGTRRIEVRLAGGARIDEVAVSFFAGSLPRASRRFP